MGSFSVAHWLVVLAIVVLLFGAKKIPELAKGLGKGIKSFKEEMAETDIKSSDANAADASTSANNANSTSANSSESKS